MFSERQQQILNTLKSEGKTTGDALAAALGVSKRTIYRDLTALTDAGIAVRTEGGPGGGIWLESDAAPSSAAPDADLVEDAPAIDEVAAADATPAAAPQGYARATHEVPVPRMQPARTAVLDAAHASRLAAEPTPQPVPQPAPTLPPQATNLAAALRERIHLDLSGWWQEDAPSQMTVDLLQDAIFANHTMRIQFTDSHEQPIIEPYGLVAKAGVWYLVWRQGVDFVADRLARIQSAEIMDRRFTRHADFNLDTWWHAHSNQFVVATDRYRFVALVRRSRIEFLRLYVGGELHVEPMDTQRVRVRFEVASPEAAVMIVLGLGQDAEVIEPDELPLMVRRAAAGRPIHDGGRAPSVAYTAPSAPQPAPLKPSPLAPSATPAPPIHREPEPLPARTQGPELFPSAPVGTIVHG